MHVRRRTTLAGIAAVLLSVGFASPAAATHVSDHQRFVSHAGSYVEFIPDADKFKVCDTESDGNAAYVDWYTAKTSGRDVWSGGSGTCHAFDHNFGEGNRVNFQSCERVDNWPDRCSEYVWWNA